jgi:glutathione synthase/RimK-type ligase-like ATP-grasp enzyme
MIAYLRRKVYEETDAKFMRFPDVLPILYEDIQFRRGTAYAGDVDLSTVDAMYFRAVGSSREMVNELVRIAQRNNTPVVDRYLLTNGAEARTKLKMHRKLEIRQPVFHVARGLSRVAQVATDNNLDYPYVAKVSKGGRQGLGTFFVQSADDIDLIRQELIRRHNDGEPHYYDRGQVEWIVQEYIPNNGDYRAIVVGGECIGITKRGPKDDGLVMNSSRRGSRRFRNARWPRDVGDLAVQASNELDVDVAGVDVVRHSRTREPYVIEVNETPRFHSFEKVTRIDVAEKILDYVRSMIHARAQD